MPRTPAPDRDAFWRKLIAQQSCSHLTVAELCQQARVSSASFYAWRQRLKAPGGGTSLPSSLVPVRVVADQHGGGEITIGFADIPSPTAAIRVGIPPGCDEASIRRVLRAVMSARAEGRSSC